MMDLTLVMALLFTLLDGVTVFAYPILPAAAKIETVSSRKEGSRLTQIKIAHIGNCTSKIGRQKRAKPETGFPRYIHKLPLKEGDHIVLFIGSWSYISEQPVNGFGLMKSPLISDLYKNRDSPLVSLDIQFEFLRPKDRKLILDSFYNPDYFWKIAYKTEKHKTMPSKKNYPEQEWTETDLYDVIIRYLCFELRLCSNVNLTKWYALKAMVDADLRGSTPEEGRKSLRRMAQELDQAPDIEDAPGSPE